MHNFVLLLLFVSYESCMILVTYLLVSLSINNDLEELMNKHTNNAITEIRNTLEGINSRISEAERISELEDKMVEITSEEQNKVKRMTRTKDSLRDLWDNIKCTNI